MTGNIDALPNTPTPSTIEQIALQIKSLEQQITSVTLPRNASVLDLKNEIRVAFDVESERQRLIFQGRVLKDDKHLTDYANLDDGKVIHLVIRPTDVPHNPMNDDPNPGVNMRTSFHSRGGGPNGRPRTLPSITSRFPMMEGYALITLDSTLNGLDDNQNLLSSILNGFSSHGPGNNRNRNSDPATTATATTATAATAATANTGVTGLASPTSNRSPGPDPAGLGRSQFAFTFARNNSSNETNPSIPSPLLGDRVAPNLPFPPSVEVRLARTLGSMRNVQSMLEDTNNEESNSHPPTTPNSTPEQLQEIRNRLRASGNGQSAQIGLVLNELADLMTEAAPRMRDVARRLRQENNTAEEERSTSRRVRNMSRIVQGLSLINHFLGSVLANADVNNLRQTNSNATSNNGILSAGPVLYSRPQLVRRPSSLFSRGNTEAIRAVAPATVRTASSPGNSGNNSPKQPEKSTLSSSSSCANSLSNSIDSESRKRKLDSDETEDESSTKKTKNTKGKEKDKKD